MSERCKHGGGVTPVAVFCLLLLLLPRPASAANAPRHPQRICSTMLGADEILLEIAGPDRLACVSEWVDKMPETKGRFPRRITRVGVEVEKVIAAKPDLVIAVPSSLNTAFSNLLKKTGLRVHHHGYWRSFAEIAKGITVLGDLTGEAQKAAALRRRFQTQAAALRRQSACERTRPRVLYYSGGWSPGLGTSIHDLIEHAGGRNVAGELKLKGWQNLAMEKILAADPDVIFFTEPVNQALGQAPLLRSSRAYRQGRVFSLGDAPVSSVSPGVLGAVRRLGARLHPNCFIKGRNKKR